MVFYSDAHRSSRKGAQGDAESHPGCYAYDRQLAELAPPPSSGLDRTPELRRRGTMTGGPAAITPKDRSRFLAKLDEAVNAR
jgi:hypothetical protein